MWDEVVECYRLGGRNKEAEEAILKRLAVVETPRMWTALGDLTQVHDYYRKALELSNGKFSDANVALGRLLYNSGCLCESAECIRDALTVKPINPSVWFFYGTICMRLEEWDDALHAFSEVVQQEPAEGDAWANIAAIHIRSKNPAKAYAALNEVSCQCKCSMNLNT